PGVGSAPMGAVHLDRISTSSLRQFMPATTCLSLPALHGPRAAVATLVTLLLVAVLGGGAVASGFGLARGARTIFLPGPLVTATAQLGANAPSIPSGTPPAQVTPTPVPPALTLSPSPLVLLQQDKRACSATQTSTNQRGRTVGWS